jgi:Flp pilus assembly protein TadD
MALVECSLPPVQLPLGRVIVTGDPPQDAIERVNTAACEYTAAKNDEGKVVRRTLTLPELLAQAVRKRDEVLEENNRPLAAPEQRPTRERGPKRVWSGSLGEARDCYSRALKLAPDDYETILGIGIVYVLAVSREVENVATTRGRPPPREIQKLLAAARAGEPDAVARTVTLNHLVFQAKAYLGQAYVSSAGAYDAVYYAAVLALLEEDYSRAWALSHSLLRAGVHEHAATLMLGYINERTGHSKEARDFYLKALDLGAAPETIAFLGNRLEVGAETTAKAGSGSAGKGP